MKIRVLGCSGGIGLGFHTSSYLINNNILIDAGTGVGQLTIDEMQSIDHVFITHVHMDHIACLPLLIDTTITNRQHPINVWAGNASINALKSHIFNDTIWPDFSRIPSTDHPFLRYRPMEILGSVMIDDLKITAIAVTHSIPTVAYQLTTQDQQHFILCGDTGEQVEFWDYLNQLENIKGLAIETAFSDQEIALAKQSKHLSPSLLITELAKLQHKTAIYLMHLKPGQSEIIIKELYQQAQHLETSLLYNNQVIHI